MKTKNENFDWGFMNEATPFDNQASTQPGTPRRDPRPTQQMSTQPQTQQGKSDSWYVTIKRNNGGPGAKPDETYHVPFHDQTQAIAAVKDMWEKENPGTTLAPGALTASATPPVGENEGATAGSVGAMGGQSPLSPEMHEAVMARVRARVLEIVRKKAGGGGYVLYGPNKGKKKNPKPAGDFPTRSAAKRAELARFPPKDPEALKRARAKLDKLAKDPEKRAKADAKDLTGTKKPKRTGAPARERKAKKEAIIQSMAKQLAERLFHEDEVPGSAWDERVQGMDPEAIASDKKLANLHKGIEKASIGALSDGHKAMSKALRGIAKVTPGDHSFDPARKKMYIPCHLDVKGDEVGPIHLYVDGGHVKVEVSNDAREQIANLEPPMAKDLRGGLMTFQEDHLPKIDCAKKAWGERDSYLDKLHGKLTKHLGGMSGVEHHLAKDLIDKGNKQ